MESLDKVTITKTEFDETIQRILQGRQYSHLRKGFGDSLSRLKEAIGKWITRSLSNLTSEDVSISPAMADRLSSVAVIIGTILLLAMITFIIFKVNRTLEKKKKVTEILGEIIDERTTPTSLKKKAHTFLKSGDFRQAVRYDFIALLLLMNNFNLIWLDETKTNEEIYQSLRKINFPMKEDFLELSRIFNSSWYGHKTTGRETYQNWSNQLDRLWNEVLKNEK